MKNNDKYIGINNRIPFHVLDLSLGEYIHSEIINKEVLLNHIKEITHGENRAKKSVNNLCKLLIKNETIIKKYRKTLQSHSYFDMSLDDRKILVLCLFCLTYPIAYEMLIIMSKGFKVQKLLNKLYLKEKIGAIYGGNRAVHIAIDEVLPLFIEIGIIKRQKIGIYVKNFQLETISSFLSETIVYTDILLSGSKSLFIEEISFRPFYDYFRFNLDFKYKYLIQKAEGSLGRGYVKI